MKKILSGLSILAILAACQTPATDATATDEKVDAPAVEAENTANQAPATPEGARVFFANLKDGDTLSSPFLMEFGIEGMEVEPAGAVNPGKGHHHILINNSYIEFNGSVPADSVNIHYGGGQTSDSLDLNPGRYTLTMQFADGYHRSYGKELSSTIKVLVK